MTISTLKEYLNKHLDSLIMRPESDRGGKQGHCHEMSGDLAEQVRAITGIKKQEGNEMIRIKIFNLTLIITDTCPTEFAECAIKCLDKRLPKIVSEWIEDEPRLFIPRYSKFIGQLSGR